MTEKYLLIISQDQAFPKTLLSHLSKKDSFVTENAPDQELAWGLVQNRAKPFTVIIVDMPLSEENRVTHQVQISDFIHRVKSHHPYTQLIVLTERGIIQLPGILEAGAYRCLAKPDSNEEYRHLWGHIHMAAEQKGLEQAGAERKILEQLMIVNQAIIEKQREEDVSDVLVKSIQATGFDRVRLYILSDDGKYYVGENAAGMDVPFSGFKLPVEQDPRLKQLHEHYEPQLTIRRDGKPLPYDQFLDRADVDEWIFLPLVHDQQIVGLLVADNKYSRKPIRPEEWEVPLRIFASLAAATMHNVRLTHQANLARQIAEERALQLETIRQIVLTITSETDQNTILNRIVQGALRLLGAQYGGIKAYNPYKKCLEVIANIGHPHDIMGHQLTLNEGMAGYLWNSPEDYVIIPDYRRWPHHIPDYAKDGWLESIVAVKLRWQERAIGVLYVGDEVSHQFTIEQAQLLQLFADHAAITLIKHERETLFKRLVTGAPLGVIANNEQGIIVEFNEQAERLLGQQATDMLGTHVKDLYAVVDEATRIGSQIREKGHVLRQRTHLRHHNGQLIPVRLSVLPVIGFDGHIIHYVGYFEHEADAKDQLDLLLSTTKTLAEAENLEFGLQNLAREITRVLKASFCRIFLLEERTQSLLMTAVAPVQMTTDGFGWEPQPGQGTPVTDWQGLRSILFHYESHLLTVNDPSQSNILKRWSDMLKLSETIQSLFVVPIRTRDKKVVGLLDIGEMKPWQEAPITEERKRLVLAITQQIAGLIERFIAEKRLMTAFQASSELVASPDFENTLLEITQQVQAISYASGIRMMLMGNNEEDSEDIIVTGDESLQIKNAIRWRQGLSREIMNTGLPIAVEDTLTTSLDINPTWRERGIRAAVGYPFSLDGHSAGVMWFYYKTPHYFSVSEMKAYELFVNQVAAAYQAWKHRQIQETAKEIAQISTLAQEEKTKTVIVKRLRKVMRCDVVSLNVYHQGRGWIFPPVLSGNEQDLSPYSPGQSPPTLLQKIHKSKQLLWFIDDVSNNPLLRRSQFTRQEQITSCAIVKLQMQGELLGVLFISYRQRHHFSSIEREALSFFAHQAAIALRNAHLYEQAKDQQAILEMLHGVAQTVTGSLEPNHVLHLLAQKAKQLLEHHSKEINHTSIWLVKPNSHTAQPLATWPLEDLEKTIAVVGKQFDYLKGVNGKIGIVGRAIQKASMENVANVHLQADYLLTHAETRSELAVPFRNPDHHIIGVINIESRRFNAFDSHDEAWLGILAQYAGIAIQNAQQHAELRKTKSFVGPYSAISYMKMVNEMYRHTIMGKVRKVRSQIAWIQELLPTPRVSDEFRILYALLDEVNRVIAPLSPIENLSLNQLVKEYLESRWNMDRMLNGNRQRVKLNLSQLRLEIDKLYTVRASRVIMQSILEWVVDNAMRAMHETPATHKELLVATDLLESDLSDERYLQLIISDKGPGFPQSMLEQQGIIWQEDQVGGVGLPLTHSLIEIFAGKVILRNKPDGGATVIMTLPVQVKEA